MEELFGKEGKLWPDKKQSDIIQFGLVWFYGISTIVGYLIPNSFNTYILDISKKFSDNIFKQAWAHFFTQLNGFTHFCLIQIILFKINHLFAHS